MGYFENERDSKTPIEGYEFTHLDQVWRVNPTHRKRFIGNELYLPLAIKRGSTRSAAEISADETEITIPTSHPIVAAFMASNKSLPFKVKIVRGHIGGAALDYAVIFRGHITEADRGRLFTTFTVANIRNLFVIETPNYTFQSQCNHILYGPRCRADREDFSYEVVLGDSWVFWNFDQRIVASVIGSVPAGFFDNGVMTFVDSTGKEHKRTIIYVRYDAGYFYINDPLGIPEFNPPTGKTVVMTAGCDHHYATCQNRFSNTPNFGGFPFMRTRDPKRGII